MSSILFNSNRMRKKLGKNRKNFFIFFWSPVSRIVPKNVKGDLKQASLPLPQVPVEVVWQLVLVQVSL